MDHRIIHAVEKAFGWSGPDALGTRFARGSILDRDLCARLLTPTRLLDLIMRRSLASPQLRCFRNGTELHPNDYLTVVTTRREQNFQMADMRRLGRLLQSGCTLVLDMVGAFEPSMEVTCRALQWWSRELVQVNAYLTTQDTSGFALHWDDHDILVVQLAGDKYWEVRSRSRSVPMYRDTAQNRTPSDDVIWTGNLSAGDVMHIPRGYWHQATRADQGEGFSLHVTFGFVKRTGVDWLTWLADRSRENELFRHDVNRWGSSPERAAQGDELLKAASRLLTSLSPSDFLIERQDSRPPHRHVTTFGIFGAPAAVVCVTEFPPRLEQCGDAIEVFAAGKKITLAARAAPALRMLLSGHPVNLSEATTATGIDAGMIADVLVTEGICAELTPELLSGYIGLVTNENFLKEP